MTAQLFNSTLNARGTILSLQSFLILCAIFHGQYHDTWVRVVLLIFAILVLLDFLSGYMVFIIDTQGIRNVRRFGLSLTWRNPEFAVPYTELQTVRLFNNRQGYKQLEFIDVKNGINTLELSFYPQSDQLIEALAQQVGVTDQTVQPQPSWRNMGKRWVVILNMAIILLILAMLFGEFLAEWHATTHAFYRLLVITVPVSALLAYLYIGREKKAHALPLAIISGVVLAGCINVVIITINQHYTEHYGKPQTYRFVLESGSADQQRWYLPEQLVVDKAYIDLYRHSKVDYQPGLPQYYVYAIQVKTGYLNDWVFAPDAFKQAKQQEKAFLKQLSNL